jgi:hypothetical protein
MVALCFVPCPTPSAEASGGLEVRAEIAEATGTAVSVAFSYRLVQAPWCGAKSPTSHTFLTPSWANQVA